MNGLLATPPIADTTGSDATGSDTAGSDATGYDTSGSDAMDDRWSTDDVPDQPAEEDTTQRSRTCTQKSPPGGGGEGLACRTCG